MSTVSLAEVADPRQHTIPTPTPSGAAGLRAGSEQTLEVLRLLHRRQQVLGLIDDAISPCGREVTVVLTTYGPIATHSAWPEHGLHGAEVNELAAQARDHARLAGELLEILDLAVPVMPVVVVWGPDETAVPRGGRVRHDVMFLRGSELRPWLRGYLGRGSVFTEADATGLTARLAALRSATLPA